MVMKKKVMKEWTSDGEREKWGRNCSPWKRITVKTNRKRKLAMTGDRNKAVDGNKTR